MLSHNDLKKGIKFILDDQPYEVLDSSFLFKGRGSSVAQAKVKNLITGAVFSKTFHAGENFKEAEIEKIKIKFLYCHRDKFFFCQDDNSVKRFDLPKEVIGQSAVYLKSNEIVEGIKFQGKIINIFLPIKVQLEVIEAPPGIKGNRAQSGTKTAILETGIQINVPLFIETGDVIEVNTEKGEYVRRIE
ncbi:MAG: elongation factor P [bacterium]